MLVTGMNHFTVLTDDVERTVAFYDQAMGLKPGPRPDLGFPGAWLYAGGAAVLHVIGGRPKEQLRPGVLDHMAFSAKGLGETLARLERLGIHYAHRRQAGAGTWQVFFFDPNGARVELDFDPAEPDPTPTAEQEPTAGPADGTAAQTTQTTETPETPDATEATGTTGTTGPGPAARA